jgi:hypothetical protein
MPAFAENHVCNAICDLAAVYIYMCVCVCVRVRVRVRVLRARKVKQEEPAIAR